MRDLRAHPAGDQERRGGGVRRMPAHDSTVAASAPGLSRRGLLRSATGAAFILGFWAPVGVIAAMEGGEYAPNAFIRIDAEGGVTLIMPQVEMGQGVYTAISMSLAEELDADWSKVR